MAKSKIEWTESTWNPVTGCTKISPGCKNCYAERFSNRLRVIGHPHYRNGFRLTAHEKALEIPLTWKRPQRIFVNSMSDLFHKEVPLDFMLRAFDVMAQCPQHCFQILTKRSRRLLEENKRIDWPDNVWMGVSVESEDYAYRIDHLRQTGAKVKFASFEPLLEAIPEPELDGIDWVIVGGESGPKSRPLEPDWVRQIRDRAISAGIPFFFKQWGGFHKKKNGRQLDGRCWDEMPRLSRQSLRSVA
jgi:protein gp37